MLDIKGYQLEDGLKIIKGYGYKVELVEIKPARSDKLIAHEAIKRRVVRQHLKGDTVILTVAADMGKDV